MRDATGRRSIIVLAGPKSHGPEGNGVHDYPTDARLLAAMLTASEVGGQVACAVFDDGDWPDAQSIAAADAVVVLSDGKDGDKPYLEAIHLSDPARMADVAALQARGGGIAVLHFGLFATQAQAPWVLDHLGGYFQWQDDRGERVWSSAIHTVEAKVEISGDEPRHPVLNGIAPFRLVEEFYHDLTMADDGRNQYLLSAPALPSRRAGGDRIAWVRQPVGGGRAFVTGLGHATANLQVPDYRRVLLNGIAWAAGIAVPAGGISAPWIEPASLWKSTIRVLLLAGNEAHRWHNWPATTPLMRSALERDPRIQVTVSTDPEDLGRLSGFDAVVLNYCNWEDGSALSQPARAAFASWLANGGGLVVQHFSNGAFHFSLRGAEASDWPEYRRIVRRVWDHHPPKSSHDRYRNFLVRIDQRAHPITAGLVTFATDDELYVEQRGDAPIEPLAWAKSTLTGADAPLAWAYRYGRGRVFQNLLGHDANSWASWSSRELLRGGVAWVAGQQVRRIPAVQDQVT
ncbi:hypothetical protein LBMAG53_34340 [Planctomycetota bacterium]|nr:hypothetical protein LBMAG53_34340 [Planctomycetota bacterium]